MEQFTNNASTTLNGSITSGATSLVVTTATAFPTSGNFRLVVDSGANLEYMLVTAVSGTTFTVTRGQEGTTAVAHNSGVLVTHIITAAAVGAVRGDWQVAYDVDFGTVGGVTPQSFNADTTFTIDGKTWTVVNHTQCTFSIDSSGLFWSNITGAGSYDVNPPTRTSCIIQAVITQFIPAFEMDWGLRLSVWNSVNSAVSQYQRTIMSFDDGTSNQIYAAVKEHRQDLGVVVVQGFSGVLGAGGPTPYFVNDTTNTSDDVFVVEMDKAGGRLGRTYSGVYSSGWPANTALRKRAELMIASGASKVNMTLPANLSVLFTAADDVSTTGTYSPRIRRMRIEYKV